jgi:serine/threonine protein kinase
MNNTVLRLLPHRFASGLTEAPLIRAAMPPASKPSATKKSLYGWTTGTKRSIIHEEFIGVGGFAEVHKVTAFDAIRPEHLDEIP